jgi:hypothetical protein
MPTDEESLIRHCTLGRAEVDLIQAKRTPHNRLGLAIQLCFLHHLGRAILLGETPPAPMVAFVAQQIGINPPFGSLPLRRLVGAGSTVVPISQVSHIRLRSPARRPRPDRARPYGLCLDRFQPKVASKVPFR